MEKPDKKEKPLLAKNIVARRKALGWKNANILAEKAKIPYGTLRDIEAGYSGGQPDTREAIAKALGCSVNDLYQDSSAITISEIDGLFNVPKDILFWISNHDVDEDLWNKIRAFLGIPLASQEKKSHRISRK